MATKFKHKIIDPLVIPVIVVVIVVGGVTLVGESLLSVHKDGGAKDSASRPELWLAGGTALVILAIATFLVTLPKGKAGILDKPVAFGTRPFFDEAALPSVPESSRQGAQGKIEDVTEGFVLYAQSGVLATAIGHVPGGSDHGKSFAGYIYAKGRLGATGELWVPYEAVLSVFPESKSVFLSIKGDETEAFGWNIPPESIRRGPARKTDDL